MAAKRTANQARQQSGTTANRSFASHTLLHLLAILDCGYTIREMAAIVNIHPSWIYRKIQRGEMTIQKNERFGCYLFPRNPNSIEQIRQLKNKEVRHVSVPEVH